jgi:tetratricopeptide (TPR) repeat protein
MPISILIVISYLIFNIFYPLEEPAKAKMAARDNIASPVNNSPIPPCFLPSSKENHINTILECNQVINADLYLERAYYNRGLAYLKLGKYDLALADCKTSIKLSPEDARGYYNCGVSHYELGQFEHALEEFTATTELAPNWMMGYYKRAMTFVKLERWEDAEDDNLYAWYLNRKHY